MRQGQRWAVWVCRIPRGAGRLGRGQLGMPMMLVQPTVFQAAGPSAESIQSSVDAFRAALGEPNNGNDPGPLPSGRREINWDGGGSDDTTTPPVTPFNVFLDSRGGQFTTPGTGLSQAPPSGGPQGGLAGLFDNPTYGRHLQHLQPVAPVHPGRQQHHRGVVLHPRHQWGASQPRSVASARSSPTWTGRMGADPAGSHGNREPQHADRATSAPTASCSSAASSRPRRAMGACPSSASCLTTRASPGCGSPAATSPRGRMMMQNTTSS